MTSRPSDEELMLRTGRGDRVAFAELVQRGLDRHAAEDCVQDTFLRLLGAADSYRPRAPFRGFLVRLAVNTLIDWRRRRRATSEPLPDGRGPSPADDIAARAGLPADERLDLAHALGGLSSKLRAVVELSMRDGYTHVEIARLLGVPHGTVKTRMHWAVRRLREALGDER